MTTTSAKAGGFEARFFHKLYTEEFGNVSDGLSPSYSHLTVEDADYSLCARRLPCLTQFSKFEFGVCCSSRLNPPDACTLHLAPCPSLPSTRVAGKRALRAHQLGGLPPRRPQLRHWRRGRIRPNSPPGHGLFHHEVVLGSVGCEIRCILPQRFPMDSALVKEIASGVFVCLDFHPLHLCWIGPPLGRLTVQPRTKKCKGLVP